MPGTTTRLCDSLLAAGLLLLTGCLSVPREEPAAIHTFVLSPDPAEQRAAVESHGAGAPVLLLNLPLARPGFDSARMAYVKRPHELAYYATHQWADAPARMLRSLLLLQLERGAAWQAVVALP
ncbi:MAG: ABC-type transport auxiliary lipoprotein family protein, partial [Nitrospiraceae bacterium]